MRNNSFFFSFYNHMPKVLYKFGNFKIGKLHKKIKSMNGQLSLK